MLRLVGEAAQDARHAIRLWGKRPVQAAIAIVALAIGIGANVGVFSVVNALLFRGLPFRDADRLAVTKAFIPPHGSSKQFHDWAQGTTYLQDAAVLEDADFNIGDSDHVERAHIAQTSANFFALLGTRPVLGRAFERAEDMPGHGAVAVISYGLWQQLFAGESPALGATIRLNGGPVSVIGVAPPDFKFPSKTVLWKAADYSPGNNGWATIVRLKSGVTWEQAQAAFSADARRVYPNRRKIDLVQHPSMLISLRDQLAGPVKNASLLLMAGVAFILLIACTNLANLLLARTTDRAAELSVRSALGASRARLTRQLLTECLLLSCTAAGIGVALAALTAHRVAATLSADSYSTLDGRVLGFAVGVAILTGLLFGIAPAPAIGRVHVFSGRGPGDQSNSRFTRECFVIAQIAMTMVLLASSISVGRAFLNILHADRGFDTRGLVTVSVSLDGTTRGAAGHQLPYFEEALARIRQLPGVRSASVTEFLPLYTTGFVGGPFGLDGRSVGVASAQVTVMADYFKTVDGRVLYGREFTDGELRSDAKVALVNDVFAKKYGGPADVVGHQLTLGNLPARKIVGVVKGMHYLAEYISPVQEDINASQVFVPAHSPGNFFPASFIVRVRGRAGDHVAPVRDAVRSVDKQVPIFAAMTMEQRLNEVLARPRFYRTAAAFFGGFSLLLSAIGIYGIAAYAVIQRTREMGVRLALGTTPSRVRGMVLGQNLLAVIIGGIIGIAGAAASGRFLGSLIEGAESASAVVLLFSIFFLFGMVAVTIWTATRRIARLDIADILRAE